MNEILALLADGKGAVDVALLDALEHLLDDLGLAGAVLTDDEQETLDDNGDTDEGEQQNRPHDFFSGMEKVHHGHIASVFIFQENREGDG